MMENGGLPSGVIKDGWLENPQTEWRFKNEKIIDFYGPFSSHVWLLEGNVIMCNYYLVLYHYSI